MERQNPTAAELLTFQFYEWEQRGRGWLRSIDFPVELEPPFHPFFYHTIQPRRWVDDSRVPTLFSGITEFFRGKPTPNPSDGLYEPTSIELFPFRCPDLLDIFSVFLPKGYKVSISETEQLLVMLSYAKYPMSFEIIARYGAITIQFTCRQSDSSHVRGQLKAYFPGCIIKEREDVIINEIAGGSNYISIVEFGLQDEFMRPLASAANFNLDPFIGIFGALEAMEEDEYIAIQILFKGTINPWAESILRSVTGNEGKGFFVNAPEMLPLAKEKVSYPLFGVSMRVIGCAPTIPRATFLSTHAGKAFVRIYTSDFNSLVYMQDENVSFDTKLDDIALRQSHRFGMLLNLRELATVVHLPSDSVITATLERDMRKTKAAPALTEGHELVLGVNEHQGKTREVTLASAQRLKHTHIIGATGTGKSTFLLNLIEQDIRNGNGIGVLDPHGDLIDSILSYIPEERINDVIIIDPADSEWPVGFNFLTAHSEIEKDILSSDLVAVFRRLSASWGDQMNSVFANAILAFVESTQGGTLADLRRFLVEKSFRDSFLKTVTDPNIVYYWQKEYPLLKSSSIGSILIRLDTFLRPKLIRNMVAQKQGIDFEQLMDSKKIVLVKLSQGLIGAENSYLLGTVIVSKIQQAAMARQAKAKEARSDFFLYIDEFQNFITPSMSSILSGARKYHLGLVLAHQDMSQLLKQDNELANSVLANAGTRICFRVGDTDAKRFADGFSFFEAKDLQNLNTGEAIVRIDRPENDFSLTTSPLDLPPFSDDIREKIITHSREKYGTPRHLIETVLQETNGIIESPVPKPLQEERPLIRKEPTVPSEPVPREISPLSEAQQTEITERLVRQKEHTDHRYLQSYIKQMAESRGYVAKIEEPTPDGKGRVDVSIERNGKRIACEVCVTTDAAWEVHNIEKCLHAGYDLVVECSKNAKVLEQIRKKVHASLDASLHAKVLIGEPKTLFDYLDQEMAKEEQPETRIKGFRVNVTYDSQSEDSLQQKKESIARIIANSLKKKKK